MDEKQPSSSSSTGISAAAPTAVTTPPLAHIPSSPGHAVSSSVYQHPTHSNHLKFGDIEHTTFAHAAACDKDASSGDKHCEFERVDALTRRTHSSRRYLFRRPRPLQYFRGNTLVRDPCERTSERLELFFDLTFVGLTSVLAKECVEHPDGGHLAKYLLTFAPAFMVWTYIRELMNSFWNDDLQQRGLVLFVMVMLIVYGNNAPAVEQNLSEGPARATAIGAYLIATGAIASMFLFYSFFVKPWRIQVRAHFLLWIPIVGIWIGAMFADVRQAAVLATVAIILEYFGWMFVYSTRFQRFMNLFYSSAVAIEHEVDRFNDFFTLVMGEFIYSSISGQPAGLGVHAGVGRAALALVVAFSFQLLYVGGSGCKKTVHPIRKSVLTADLWFSIHLPIVSALTIVGDASAELIKDNLDVPSGVRWIFCGGYSVAMLGIWVLAMLDTDQDVPGEIWFPMKTRLGGRLISGIIVVFLPLAPQEIMTSNKLLGIAAALSLATLLWEMISSLEGPNSAAYIREDDDLTGTGKEELSTINAGLPPPSGSRAEAWAHKFEWRGRPCFYEPGLYVPDRSHQRLETKRTGDEKTAAR